MSDPDARQNTISSKIDRWLRVGTTLVPVVFVALFISAVFWPVEGQVPFDSNSWKQSTQPSAINIRTRMKDDLVRRIHAERWSVQRAKDELGPENQPSSPQVLRYEMGRRRGMWPFRSWGFMTGFDTWHLIISLDQAGSVQDARAVPD